MERLRALLGEKTARAGFSLTPRAALVGGGLINPRTALYLGYNANYDNIEVVGDEPDHEVVLTDGDLMKDARQIFVKVSYLFRF